MVKKKVAISLAILILITSTTAFTESAYWSGGKLVDGHTYYNYHSSVSSYGYKSYYDHAVNAWKGITPKVTFTYSTWQYADKYYVGNTSSSNTVGRIIPYTTSGIETSLNSNWGYVRVYLYDNNIKKFNWTTTNIKATATHEVGHSLKLKHPPLSPDQVTSIMHQGRKNFTYPTGYDKNNLRAKWGN